MFAATSITPYQVNILKVWLYNVDRDKSFKGLTVYNVDTDKSFKGLTVYNVDIDKSF